MANPNGTPENLRTPWQPGQSGNPAGRPKGSVSLLTLLKDKLAENDGAEAKAIVDALIEDAKTGNVKARKLVMEYIEGKPKDNGGEPVEHTVRVIRDDV